LNTLAPSVARRIVELREIMPELAVLAVSPEGAAFCEYVDDDGERQRMIVPVRPPARDVDPAAFFWFVSVAHHPRIVPHGALHVRHETKRLHLHR